MLKNVKITFRFQSTEKKKRRRKKRDKILMNFPDAATCTFGNVVHHFLVLFEELCNHPVVGLIIQEVASK